MTGLSMQMVFSPQRCTLERLDETLTTSRRDLAERLLRQYTPIAQQGGSHHTLLVGPRGSGKSHVLTYFAKKLMDSAGESGMQPNILVLPEEERSIARPLDFILALLRALRVPEDVIRAKVRGTDPESLMTDATSLLDESVARMPTLILVENLNEIFDAVGPDALPRLRAFFQAHANISIIGTTTALWNDSDRPDHPFYGFFEITTLRELTRQEAHRYLRALAQADGDLDLVRALASPMGKARVKAIYHLTGGNPRLLTMLSAFLTADGLEKLIDPFVQMADRELTPYYQQRLGRLSPTQGKVVQLLADRPAPQTVTEIAERGYLQQQVTSRALHDLMQTALVNRHPRGRESYYELREPLLRLVLDLKVSGEEPLGLIVDLLRLWYDTEELKSLEASAPARAKVYLRAAMEVPSVRAEAVGSMRIAEVHVSGSGKVTEREPLREIMLTVLHGFGALEEDKLEEALSDFERAIAACEGVTDCDFEYFLSFALNGKGLALEQMGGHQEALAVLAEVERRYGTNERPELHKQVAMALYVQGLVLDHLDRHEEALTKYTEVVRRLENSERPELQHLLAKALLRRGVASDQLGRHEDALVAFAELVGRFGDDKRPELQKEVAKALNNRGVTLSQLGRHMEARESYAEVVRRFEESGQLELRQQVARALLRQGLVLDELGNPNEALAVYAEVLGRFGESGQPELQEQVAEALIDQGVALGHLGRHEDALRAFAEFDARFGASDRPELQQHKAGALFNRGMALGNLGRDEDALGSFTEVESRFGASDRPELQDYVVLALFSQGATLFGAGRAAEALRAVLRFLAITRPEGKVRRNAVAGFIALLRDRPTDLKDFIQCLDDDHHSLVAGLTDWIASQMPMTEETAKRLEESEAYLADAFAEIPAAQLPLKMLNAARRDALGDTRALLELPLELRRLIKPEPEDEAGDTEEG